MMKKKKKNKNKNKKIKKKNKKNRKNKKNKKKNKKLATCDNYTWVSNITERVVQGAGAMQIRLLVAIDTYTLLGDFTFWTRTTSHENPIIWMTYYQIKLVLRP